MLFDICLRYITINYDFFRFDLKKLTIELRYLINLSIFNQIKFIECTKCEYKK